MKKVMRKVKRFFGKFRIFKRLNNMQEDIELIEAYIENIRDDVDEIQGEIENKIHYSVFMELENIVNGIEGQLDDIDDRLNNTV